MAGRCRGLVTSDKPTILAEPLLDAIVTEDCQSDECLADPTSTDESGRSETFCQSNDLRSNLHGRNRPSAPREVIRQSGWVEVQETASINSLDR